MHSRFHFRVSGIHNATEATIKTDVLRIIYRYMNIIFCGMGRETYMDFIESLSIIELRRAIADEWVELHSQRRFLDVDLSEGPFNWATLGYMRPV